MAPSGRGLGLGLPRLQTFLGLMSLQTGTELLSTVVLLNKIIGIYGILAIFTGYKLSFLQVSMYFYSVLVAVALAYLIPNIRKQSPFHNLALAWLHVFDTFANIAYTTAFAVTWFQASYDPKGPAGAETGADPGKDIDLDDKQAAQANAGLGTQETATSLVLIIFLSMTRLYFSLVVMSFARTVIQSYVEGQSGWGSEERSRNSSPNPFAVGSPLSEGWKGKLGRSMISVCKGYWLTQKAHEEWTRDVNAKLKTSPA